MIHSRHIGMFIEEHESPTPEFRVLRCIQMFDVNAMPNKKGEVKCRRTHFVALGTPPEPVTLFDAEGNPMCSPEPEWETKIRKYEEDIPLDRHIKLPEKTTTLAEFKGKDEAWETLDWAVLAFAADMHKQPESADE